jgi:purine nucleosidase
MQRIIIDTDPGVDDAHAILMAYAYPNVKVEAILTVNGNVGVERTTANACTILDLLGKDTPIYPGCNAPLVLSAEENAAHVHGSDGLGGANFPPSSRKVEKEHASNALVRLGNSSPGEITLVCIGPLTNIATALKLDPKLPEKIKNLVVMGGAIHSHGNTPNVSAEFNTYTDPEAAYIVFESWPEYTLISWETTMAHGFNGSQVDKWFALNTPQAKFFKKTNQRVIEYLTNVLGRKMLFAADALAMSVALEPSIVKKSEKHALTVELNGRLTRGQTTVDWFNLNKKPQKANIILEVDQDRFIQLMENALI